MNLDEYIWKNRITKRAFAVKAGIMPGTLSHILQGYNMPSLTLAMKIQEVTGGQVTWKEFIDEYLQNVEKRKKRKAKEEATSNAVL